MSRPVPWIVVLVAACLVLVAACLVPGAAVLAQAPPAGKTGSGGDDSSKQEQTALDFARRHHPELAKLIERLEKHNTPAYEKAVREVSQTRERLLRLEKNDPELHRQALQVWALDSQIRLLAARSALSDDAASDEELRVLLQKRRDARVRMLTLDRQRVTARLERIDDQIERLRADDPQAIDAELKRLKRTVSDSKNRTTPRKADVAEEADRERRKAAARKSAAANSKPTADVAKETVE